MAVRSNPLGPLIPGLVLEWTTVFVTTLLFSKVMNDM